MWFFRSSFIVFGEDALSWLSQFTGQRALIVTDRTMVALGFVQLVQDQLNQAGIADQVFAEVEPDPSLEIDQSASGEVLPTWHGVAIGFPVEAECVEMPFLQSAQVVPAQRAW